MEYLYSLLAQKMFINWFLTSKSKSIVTFKIFVVLVLFDVGLHRQRLLLLFLKIIELYFLYLEVYIQKKYYYLWENLYQVHHHMSSKSYERTLFSKMCNVTLNTVLGSTSSSIEVVTKFLTCIGVPFKAL